MKMVKIQATMAIFCTLAVAGQALAESPGLVTLERRAEAGNAPAADLLGLSYLQGRGVEQDYAKARYWFEKAAAHHGPAAMMNLGLMYLHGVGVPQDDDKAAAWFKKSSDLGWAPGQYWMGYMYQHGFGVKKDIEHAMLLYGLAANSGFKPALRTLIQIRAEQDFKKMHKDDGRARNSGTSNTTNNRI